MFTIMFVATKLYCRDKHVFVATSILCCEKRRVLSRQTRVFLRQNFRRDKNDTYGSSRQWYVSTTVCHVGGYSHLSVKFCPRVSQHHMFQPWCSAPLQTALKPEGYITLLMWPQPETKLNHLYNLVCIGKIQPDRLISALLVKRYNVCRWFG